MKQIPKKIVAVFLFVSAFTFLTGCSGIGDESKVTEYFQTWQKENPEPPKWEEIPAAPDVNELGEKVFGNLGKAKWEQLNALSKTYTGAEGTDDYWAIHNIIAQKVDAAKKDKGSDLSAEEVKAIVAGVMSEASAEQRANHARIGAEVKKAAGAYKKYREEMGSAVPDLIASAYIIQKRVQEDNALGFISKAQALAGIAQVISILNDYSEADKFVNWLEDREDLIEQLDKEQQNK